MNIMVNAFEVIYVLNMKTKLKIPNILKIKYILSCNFNVILVLKVA